MHATDSWLRCSIWFTFFPFHFCFVFGDLVVVVFHSRKHSPFFFSSFLSLSSFIPTHELYCGKLIQKVFSTLMHNAQWWWICQRAAIHIKVRCECFVYSYGSCLRTFQCVRFVYASWSVSPAELCCGNCSFAAILIAEPFKLIFNCFVFSFWSALKLHGTDWNLDRDSCIANQLMNMH